MINTNNPAGHLLSILEKATEYSASLPYSTYVKNREGWAHVLELQSSSDVDVIRAVLDVAELVRKTRVLIENFSPNPQLYLNGYENIELAIVPGDLKGDFHDTIKRITSENLAHLRFGCDLLSKHFTEEKVAEEELIAIKQIVDELFELARNAKISDQLRKYILESLEMIRRSISLYRIHGANGLQNALKLTLIGMVEHAEEIKQTKDSSPSLFDKFGQLAQRLDKLVSFATKSKELIGGLFNLLPIK